jgi:ankyrin repeat protein
MIQASRATNRKPLIENGADASISDDEGMTPLMIAASSKRVPEANLKRVIEYLNSLE